VHSPDQRRERVEVVNSDAQKRDIVECLPETMAESRARTYAAVKCVAVEEEGAVTGGYGRQKLAGVRADSQVA
jgi:hypothetical protein